MSRKQKTRQKTAAGEQFVVTTPELRAGKKNIYTCANCGHHIVTVDREEGTTPFMIGCTAFDCAGHMKSSFYRVFDQSMRPSHEWYKPTHPELATESQAVQQHCHYGGLLMRPIDRDAALNWRTR